MALTAFSFSQWIDRHAHLLKPPVGNQQVFMEQGSVGLVVEKIRPAEVNDGFEWYCPGCGQVYPGKGA